MTDDSLNDTQQNSVGIMTEKAVKLWKDENERLSDLERKIWNAAIEAVIPVATADYHVTAEEIRRLKK